MDVSGSTVQLNTSDGKMDAYVAHPKGGGRKGSPGQRASFA